MLCTVNTHTRANIHTHTKTHILSLSLSRARALSLLLSLCLSIFLFFLFLFLFLSLSLTCASTHLFAPNSYHAIDSNEPVPRRNHGIRIPRLTLPHIIHVYQVRSSHCPGYTCNNQARAMVASNVHVQVPNHPPTALTALTAQAKHSSSNNTSTRARTHTHTHTHQPQPQPHTNLTWNPCGKLKSNNALWWSWQKS